MELFEIVLKLTGEVRPVGSSNIDDERYENLKTLLELMEKLHLEIDKIATDNKDSHEFSRSRAAKKCMEYIEWLGVPE
jgi:hypothetical protein